MIEGDDARNLYVYRGLEFTLTRQDNGAGLFVVVRRADGCIVARDLIVNYDACASGVQGLAEEWIDKRLGLSEVPRATCAACTEPLHAVFPYDTDYQYVGVLWITLSGGYGMFIDPLDDTLDGTLRFVVCAACADVLCSANPWLADGVRAYLSNNPRTKAVVDGVRGKSECLGG